MKRRTRTPRLVLALALLGAGCAEAVSDDGAQAPAPEPVSGEASSNETASNETVSDETVSDETASDETAGGPPASAPAPPKDMVAQYAALLADVVTDDGLVRYDRLAASARRASLDEVVRWIAAAPLPPDRAARLARWSNAYNANVLALALDASRQPGFESVVKVPGFFDERAITVAGERMTLNDLENERIRPLGDARIHAALVCAARSCPPLRNEPYVAATLDEQFNDQCVRWVNDPQKFRVTGGRLGLSEILKWYAPDFDRPPHGSQAGFVLAYAKSGSAMSRYIINTPHPDIEWLTYDWSLNQAPPAPGGAGG